MSGIRKALNRAFRLGQTYWQQADSESYAQNRKSVKTMDAFRALLDETCAALAQPAEPAAWSGDPSTQDYSSTQEPAALCDEQIDEIVNDLYAAGLIERPLM